MDSFLVLPEDVRANRLTLRGDESKHLARVLRKEIGERVFCTDGNDTMYEAEVASIGADNVECDILATHSRYNEPSVDVTLAVSLLKNPARFDWLVEKTTELGVRAILPLVCERTVARKAKRERCEKIAVAAMKQCGRSYAPRVSEALRVEEIMEQSEKYDTRFVSHEKVDATNTLQRSSTLLLRSKSVLVMIGPEGGFTDAEIDMAIERAFLPISLGPRRLRVETAAITVLNGILASR